MKIVLTGGPSAGKTTLATSLVKHYSHSVIVVPESASILYRGGFPRISKGLSRLCQQRAIFKVQKELENVFELENPEKTLICDRGTLDGLAYWPESEELFFDQNGTNLQDELVRYDVVIHLEVARQKDYNSDHSDIRVESYEKALLIDAEIKKAWEAHPRRYIIKSNHDRDFIDRLKVAHHLVDQLLKAKDLSGFKGEIL
ncbi:MAG: ATP-binding protein [Bdellovibrionaceae bacterium]|nr:ATP-binding protein [Pseudobdellovibrionaceae bacterium]